MPTVGLASIVSIKTYDSRAPRRTLRISRCARPRHDAKASQPTYLFRRISRPSRSHDGAPPAPPPPPEMESKCLMVAPERASTAPRGHNCSPGTYMPLQASWCC
ncbi:hypothetical protein WOLCODRAFT_26949 [Wolfiporia cocos MD-104 SS10]|uniref:Uncharacterized protein n=1 Tax=Wolfiporia cocos (strain MD-104) TaxID=742152 RepID=A0A2H3JT16_WOLCO|nr:hypothetical protein WOLCODRAFT_26949 [Wolfiporia cocos MD-104 SS10]